MAAVGVTGIIILLAVSCRGFPSPPSESSGLLAITTEAPQFPLSASESGEEYREGGDRIFSILRQRKLRAQLFIYLSEEPAESNARDSAIATVTVKITPGETEIHYIPLPAGSYLVAAEHAETTAASAVTAATLRPGGVVLYPEVFQLFPPGADKTKESSADTAARSVTEMDQEQAARDLLDHIDFYRWAGGTFYGFGPFSSLIRRGDRHYRLTMESEPSGAEVYIDTKPVGNTPLALELEEGRYALDLIKEAYEPARIVTEIQSDTEIHTSLQKRAATSGRRLSEYGMVVQRFATLKPDEEDQFSQIFSDSLHSVLSRDPRIAVVDHGYLPREEAVSGSELSGTDGSTPAYTYAEKLGAELVLAGFYTLREGKLLVNAGLYDVRARAPKTAVLLTGGAGLSVFETIDEMAEEISRAVDRVLPERGSDAPAAARVVTAETAERRIVTAERQVLVRRQEEYPHILSLQTGVGPFGLIRKEFEVEGDPDTIEAERPFPFWYSGVRYTRNLMQNIGLSAAIAPLFHFPGMIPLDDMWAEYVLRFQPPWGVGTALALEFISSNPSVDFFLRPGAEYRYYPPVTFDIVRQDTEEVADRGVFANEHYLSATIETGVRAYTNSRFSERPRFITLGLQLNPYVKRLEALSDKDAFLGAEVAVTLYIGYGLRLRGQENGPGTGGKGK